MALAKQRMIYCTGTVDSSARRHIVRCERRRASDGAAVCHDHCGTTLCGCAVKRIYPFQPAAMLRRSGRDADDCPDCLDMYLSQKSRSPDYR